MDAENQCYVVEDFLTFPYQVFPPTLVWCILFPCSRHVSNCEANHSPARGRRQQGAGEEVCRSNLSLSPSTVKEGRGGGGGNHMTYRMKAADRRMVCLSGEGCRSSCQEMGAKVRGMGGRGCNRSGGGCRRKGEGKRRRTLWRQ